MEERIRRLESRVRFLTGLAVLVPAQFAHGGGGFALHGPGSKGAAVLYLRGEGSLRFFNEEGAVTAAFPSGGEEP